MTEKEFYAKPITRANIDALKFTCQDVYAVDQLDKIWMYCVGAQDCTVEKFLFYIGGNPGMHETEQFQVYHNLKTLLS